MNKLLLFILFASYSCYSQQIQIFGVIKDAQNRGIESASVFVTDINQNTLTYIFTGENGTYSLAFEKKNLLAATITVSSLGFLKKEIKLDFKAVSEYEVNFALEESSEILNEVVIESQQKIKINQDTTSIKVAAFGNKTEQTIEDILKKTTRN